MLLAQATAVILQCLQGATLIAGQVTDGQGQPVSGAHVFVEPGIGGALLHTMSDDLGLYSIPDVAAGPAGVFAYAPGHAWGGSHHNISASEDREEAPIRLGEAGTLRLKIINHEEEPIANARVTRLALLDGNKVAIPLAKLEAFGMDEPQSDDDGMVTVSHVPTGGRLALKVGHPAYAQEGVNDAIADGGVMTVTLHPGLLLQGEVLSLAQRAAVSGASIIIQNAQPPHDSALARSDLQGQFALRLKPGVYMARAESAAGQSPGWEEVVLTGENPSPRMRLMVAGTGVIRGKLQDAVTEKPVSGARIALESHGNRAAVVRTGDAGVFEFQAASGVNTVRFEAAPGYQPPPSRAIEVMVEEGQTFEMPGMWLAPLPPFAVTIVNEDGQRVSGAALSLLRPFQFGFHQADENGSVRFDVGVLPESGAVVGLAEAPDGTAGGLFRVPVSEAGDALVGLYPYGVIEGRTVNRRGRAVPGVVVAAMYADEDTGGAIPLWRVVSGPDGYFSWPAVVPGIPQQIVLATNAEEGRAVNLRPGETRDLGTLRVDGDDASESFFGKSLPLKKIWPAEEPEIPLPALLIFAESHTAPLVAQGLRRMGPWLKTQGIHPVLVTPDGDARMTNFPTLEGDAPASATTYVLDAAGQVRFECLGFPAITSLKGNVE